GHLLDPCTGVPVPLEPSTPGHQSSTPQAFLCSYLLPAHEESHQSPLTWSFAWRMAHGCLTSTPVNVTSSTPQSVAKATMSALLVGGFVLAGPALPANADEPDPPDCTKVDCVALTFDDGPGEHTDRLLDILGEHNAKATFYLLGSQVDEYK